MMGKEPPRGMRNRCKTKRERTHNARRRGRGEGGGLVVGKKSVDLSAYMVDSLVEVHIVDDKLVGLGTGRGGGGDQAAVREVASPPEVNRCYVPMVFNRHVVEGLGPEIWKVEVVSRKVGEKGGPDS